MFEPLWKRATQNQDRQRLDVEGSPVFNITIADILASGSMFYGMEHRAGVMDYLPMNFLRILNKGGTALAVYLNESTSYEVILPDTIFTHNGIIRNFTLSNLSTTTTATGAQIYTIVQHKPVGAQQ